MEENENLIRGDSLIIDFPITDEEGTIIPIEELDTLFLTARQKPSKSYPVLFEKEKEDFTYENEIYSIEILPTDTEQLNLKVFYYDIEATLKDGTRQTIIGGIDLEHDCTIHGGDEDEN